MYTKTVQHATRWHGLKTNLEDLGEIHQCPVFRVKKVTQQHDTKQNHRLIHITKKHKHQKLFTTAEFHCHHMHAEYSTIVLKCKGGRKYKVISFTINTLNMIAA